MSSESRVGWVKAQATPQRVSMASTGGAQVTLAVDGFPGDAKGCKLIGVQTGDNVVTRKFCGAGPRIAFAIDAAAAPKVPTPILSVSVGDLFGDSITGLQTEHPSQGEIRHARR